MPEYKCELCNFSTKIKTQLARHEKTKKHLKNVAENNEKTKEYKYICLQCNTPFSTKSNLQRHKNKNCTNTKVSETEIYKTMLLEQQKVFNEERKLIYNHIDNLLKRVGNTTINQTNNIQLNSFGKEDMSHITDSLKTQLLNIPFGMIPKLIEYVHFSSDRPENKNIVLTNKNDNKIKIFSQGKWVFRNKNETINNLVDEKYYLLDSHFDNNKNQLDPKTINKYDTFRKEYDNNTDELLKKLKQDCELTLLNNR
tara:strand:+ start:456 stop:1217 length:762 start_codon:yes stop_codon:yes gene_type:complete